MSAVTPVYAALTADYGMGRRNVENQADNVLDFDGMLHVKDVPRFVRALEAWAQGVHSEAGQRRGRKQVRDAIRSRIARATIEQRRDGDEVKA